MWNLEYQQNGKIVKLGQLSKPYVKKKAKPQRKKKNKKKIQTISFDVYTVASLERMDFLKRRSKSGPWIPKPTQAKVRSAFEKVKKKLIDLNKVLCYVCDGRADHRHHVTPICRGGLNTKKNLVPLCNKCHEEVHPWLNEVPDTKTVILAGNFSDSGETRDINSPCYAFTRSLTPTVLTPAKD